MFDIIIFDEASQMYVENAIPTIFRGKQVVIAGDDKQLRPTSTFNSRINGDEDEEEIENAAALEEESLLDLAKVNYDSVHLNYHYRSEYDDLINFSNYAFYGGTLQVSPNLKSRGEYGLPIERVMVDGRWINRSNQKEAEETVNIVAKFFKERKHKETIGIITFNINQKSLIEDMLEKRAQEDEELKKVYIEEIDRQENNEDLSLFVKNIENVQGDERDTNKNHDSDFEAEVYDELTKRGYKVDTQVGVSGYKIDLAIYDDKTSGYILGIECDGATYHSSKSARERDIHRQRYLESRGWKIARIWSKHWWRNPKGEIDKIDKLTRSLVK